MSKLILKILSVINANNLYSNTIIIHYQRQSAEIMFQPSALAPIFPCGSHWFSSRVHEKAVTSPNGFVEVDTSGNPVTGLSHNRNAKRAARQRGVQWTMRHMTQCQALNVEITNLKQRGFVGVYQPVPNHPSNKVTMASGVTAVIGGVLVGCLNNEITWSVASDVLAMHERGCLDPKHGCCSTVVTPQPICGPTVSPSFIRFQSVMGMTFKVNPHSPPVGSLNCDIFIP